MNYRKSCFPTLLTAIVVATCGAGDSEPLQFADALNHSNVIKTRWADPSKSPLSFEEWRASIQAPPPLVSEEMYTLPPAGDHGGRGDYACICVNAGLYPEVESAVSLYARDVAAAGTRPVVMTVDGGEPEEFREFLGLLHGGGMLGVVLVGDFPVAWYEYGGEEFPCDYYFMDLDGDWRDLDVDGLYDYHSGATEPEIWVGRLAASPLRYSGETEAGLINRYFEKNHDYRAGNVTIEKRGLMYVDDDWAAWGESWASALAMCYPRVVLERDRDATRPDDYRSRLPLGFETLQVCAHSSPELHQFTYDGGGTIGSVYFHEIISLLPRAVFYNLFACSNARFIENNYMGGWYIFNEGPGLVAVGSTKAGSMLHFEDYYEPLGGHASAGEAFRSWLEKWGVTDPGWFYGMAFLGDPLLTASDGLYFLSAAADDGEGFGDGDGEIDAGETINLTTTIINRSGHSVEGVVGTVEAPSPYIEVTVGTASFGDIPDGDVSDSDIPFVFEVSTAAPDLTPVEFRLNLSGNDGNSWVSVFSDTVRTPVLTVSGSRIVEISGDGDGGADPGEIIDLYPVIANSGHNAGRNVHASMLLYDPYIHVSSESVVFGDVSPGDTVESLTGLRVEIDDNCPSPHTVRMLCRIGGDFGYASTSILELQAGHNPLLLVIDDAGAGYEPWFIETLEQLSTDCDVIRRGDGRLGNLAADNFTQIIWFTGDESSGTLDEDDREDLALFLDAGGTLFLTGQDIGRDIGETDFYRDYVHASFIEDNSANHGIIGVDGDPLFDGSMFVITGPGGADNQSSPSIVAPGAAARASLEYSPGGCAGIVCEAPHRVVYFAFGFEAINTEADRREVMSRVLDFGGLAVEDGDTAPAPEAGAKLGIRGAAPNPFNPRTMIVLELRESLELNLDVYDISGKKVRSLGAGRFESGVHSITWDGTTDSGSPCASGVYLFRAGGRDLHVSSRLVLLK